MNGMEAHCIVWRVGVQQLQNRDNLHMCGVAGMQGQTAGTGPPEKRTGCVWDELLALPWRRELNHPSGCRLCQVT